MFHAHRDGCARARRLRARQDRPARRAPARREAGSASSSWTDGRRWSPGQGSSYRKRSCAISGLVLGALFAGLFGLLPLLRHRTPAQWPWILAAVLWVAALAWPRSLTLLTSMVDRGSVMRSDGSTTRSHPDPDLHDRDHAVQLRDVGFRPRPDETRLRPQGRDLPGAEPAASAARHGEAILNPSSEFSVHRFAGASRRLGSLSTRVIVRPEPRSNAQS